MVCTDAGPSSDALRCPPADADANANTAAANTASTICHSRRALPPGRQRQRLRQRRHVAYSPSMIRVRFLILASILFVDRFCSADGITWLAVAQMSSVANIERETCGHLRGLTKRQVKLCRKNIEHMDSVKLGAFLAIDECQHQFRNRRWNCSIPLTSPIYADILRLGTREAAFVHAISSAGVAHTVTRHCSSGRLEKCGCDRSVASKGSDGFQWAGCSDNIHYGSAFARQFVDAHEQRKKQNASRLLMNLHNNDAGRKLIESNMRKQCKCHGVSGSCELKTCWRSMPTFREVGQLLKERFDGATEVTMGYMGSRKVLKPINPQYKHHTDEDLVYLDNSPDYCTSDNGTGSMGTHGRMCNRTSQSTDGCDLLCCGRGYRVRVEQRVERCHCKFHWCCDVRCKECPRVEEISTCL